MVLLLLLDSTAISVSVVAAFLVFSSSLSSCTTSEYADVSVVVEIELLVSGVVKQLDITSRERNI
jgi:hypothetical protein